MSRQLTATARQQIFAQSSDDPLLILLTIDHDSLSAPIRLVNNTVNITSNSNEFVAWPFEFILPQDSPDQLPEVTLTIDNVDTQIINTLRGLSGEVRVTVDLVLASAPDDIVASLEHLTLQVADYNVFTINGRLGFHNYLNEPFPAGRFTPQNFPGLF